MVNKEKHRKIGFRRLTNNMGRGRNKALKQLQAIDETTNSVKTHHDRHDIENRTINHNRKHYKNE